MKRIYRDPSQPSRRDFLKRTGAAALSAAAAPWIIPGAALGLNNNRPASERIVMGCIGTGSQGRGNLDGFLKLKDCHVIAVCDVDKAHRDQAAEMINAANGNSDCATYNDFRELLERSDLDALSIALPDHWHAIPVVMAARKGLHMYAEKPLALTIYEGQRMVEEVEKSGVTWQTGSWQRSVEHFRKACELIRNGRIGRVHTINVGLPTGKPIEPQPVMPVPEGFDYDMWLGPAPWAPYTKERCHWNFRWILDYSGGQLTDWAAHHVDIANWAMGTEDTGPWRVSGEGVFPRTGLWNAATDYRVVCEYAPGASTVAPDGFTMILSNAFPNGAEFIGETGTLFVARNGMTTSPESLAESEIAEGEVRLYESRSHAQNFLDCVRSGEPTITPIRAAHRAITNAHLGNIAMILERPVLWDPVAEAFDDDPQATRMLRRSMRAPWHL